MKRVTILVAVAFALGSILFAFPSASAQASDVKQELRTAITHAGFAANGQAVNYIRTHLGHALNCLEGTAGPQFNRSIGHVCQGQGNGILVDLKSAPNGRAFDVLARSAESLAVAGVRSQNIDEMRNAAAGVRALLELIAAGLK